MTNTIYDQEEFFTLYSQMRASADNCNDSLEQPWMTELLGDVSGKRILDIGCGWGEGSKALADAGAAQILAFDPSIKMLDKAQELFAHERINYVLMSADQMDSIPQTFDIAVSSLALHYIEDIGDVFAKVNRRLAPGGLFVFSMEHPIRTANILWQQWLKEDYDPRIPHNVTWSYVMNHYGDEGARQTHWLGADVIKYHHRIETIFNELLGNGFGITKVIEPQPTVEMIKKFPETMGKAKARPQYLLISCRKVS